MSYKLVMNEELKEVFNKSFNYVKETTKDKLCLSHFLLSLLETEEMDIYIEKNLGLDLESRNTIRNILTSDVYRGDFGTGINNEKVLIKNSHLFNKIMSNVINFSEFKRGSEGCSVTMTIENMFELIMYDLNNFKQKGVSILAYNIFEEELGSDTWNDYIKSLEKSLYGDFKEKASGEDSLKDLEELEEIAKSEERIDNIHDLFKFSEKMRRSVESKYPNAKDFFGVPRFNQEKPNKKEKKDLPDYLGYFNKEVLALDNYESLYQNLELINKINYILAKKERSIPIIVGDSGVGKTSLIKAFCKNIMTSKSNPRLSNKAVLELDLTKLYAGCMYRGSLEEKLNKMFSLLKERKDIILFIDNLKINKNSNQQEEFMGSFFNYVSRHNIKTIITMNYGDYKEASSKYKDAISNSTIIDFEEPSVEDTLKILNDNIGIYEKYHNVSFSEEVMNKVVELSNRYVQDKRNPLKSFEIIDELGALKTSHQINHSQIRVKDVLDVISNKTKIDIRAEKTELERVFNLEKNIKKVLFGQDEAVENVASAVMVSSAGFSNDTKPYLSLMFTGTTGVGKTELVKQLSENMNRKLIRIDMSEYSEQHTVSKLIGSPQGYVGYGEGGLLTNQVKRNPHSIVLFDEIEKGHQKVFDTFLQILDEGYLTDSSGDKVSFKDTIVVFTSNAGVSEKNKKNIGFSEDSSENKINMDVLTQYFKPEFLNRIESIIEFKKLTKEVMVNIANNNLVEFGQKLEENKIELKFTPKVKAWLAEHGFDERMGARPMARLVNKEIVEPFSKLFIQKKVANKEVKTCSLSVKNNKMQVEVF